MCGQKKRVHWDCNEDNRLIPTGDRTYQVMDLYDNFYEIIASPSTETTKDEFTSWIHSCMERIAFEITLLHTDVLKGLLFTEDGCPITLQELLRIRQWFDDRNITPSIIYHR